MQIETKYIYHLTVHERINFYECCAEFIANHRDLYNFPIWFAMIKVFEHNTGIKISFEDFINKALTIPEFVSERTDEKVKEFNEMQLPDNFVAKNDMRILLCLFAAELAKDSIDSEVKYYAKDSMGTKFVSSISNQNKLKL